MMIDQEVVAASPSSVYRVLAGAGLLDRWNKKPSKKGTVPSMVARGDGAFVLGGGLTAVHTMPGMSGVGPVMAAARNFVFTLNAEAKDKASTPARSRSARSSSGLRGVAS